MERHAVRDACAFRCFFVGDTGWLGRFASLAGAIGLLVF